MLTKARNGNDPRTVKNAPPLICLLGIFAWARQANAYEKKRIWANPALYYNFPFFSSLVWFVMCCGHKILLAT